MKTFIAGQIASAKDVNDNFEEVMTATQSVAAAAQPIQQGNRIGTPPSGAQLKVACWTFKGTTNGWGQIVASLPTGLSGVASCVACSATFDTQNYIAYAWTVAVTAYTGGVLPILTVVSANTGSRVANTAVTLAIFAIGW